MARSRRLLVAVLSMVMMLLLVVQTGMTVQAGSDVYAEEMRGGVAALLNPGTGSSTEIVKTIAQELKLTLWQEEQQEEDTLVMANVKNALNVRSEASGDSEKVGQLYKDCGGTILERKDGWTKIQSGNVIGWASDEYLLFGEEAQEMAQDVGKTVATVESDTVRVRTEPGTDTEVCGLLPKGEIVEVLKNDEETGWVCVDYEGADGYVDASLIKMKFMIDSGETMEEIKARKEAEREAKRHVNYGAYTTDADTTLLLAALIQCEAGGESYEGQVAVGAVVMNRVRSSAYPDSIHGVIYASGQFTPALNGKVNKVYESGKIKETCVRAAEEALAGVSNVGGYTHFRRNNGRDGLVIGNHVFY